MSAREPDRRGEAHRGPSLSFLAGGHVVLFLSAVIVLAVASTGGWPRPGAAGVDIAGFFRSNPDQLRVVGMLQFSAAVPLLLYAAAASDRLRHLGIRAAGTTIVLVGGVVAATLLAASGLLMTVAGASAPEVDPAAATVLHQLIFVTGGAGHVVFLGLLLAGVAVTGLRSRQLPGVLSWAMLTVAVLAELATLSLAVDLLEVMIPIGRFAGMAALLAAGFLLPIRRLGPSGNVPGTDPEQPAMDVGT